MNGETSRCFSIFLEESFTSSHLWLREEAVCGHGCIGYAERGSGRMFGLHSWYTSMNCIQRTSRSVTIAPLDSGPLSSLTSTGVPEDRKATEEWLSRRMFS